MDMEIELKLTPEIIKSGVWHYWKRRAISRLGLILTAIFFGLLVGAAFADKPRSWGTFVGFGIYGLLGLWGWVLRFRIYFHILRRKMTEYNQLVDGSMCIQLGESAAVFTSGKSRWEYPWEKLRRVDATDEVVLLVWDKYNFNFSILPRQQLRDETLGLIRQKCPAGGPDAK